MINSTSADDPAPVSFGAVPKIGLPFSDSNTLTTRTATIDWGDGASEDPDVITEAFGSSSVGVSASWPPRRDLNTPALSRYGESVDAE